MICLGYVWFAVLGDASRCCALGFVFVACVSILSVCFELGMLCHDAFYNDVL